jgi:hypothetical protein
MNTILDEAKKAVYGDRAADYGPVTDNFTMIGKLWAPILKLESITPEQVGLCMVLLKVARQTYQAKRDNLIDGAGYFATLEKMAIEQEECFNNLTTDFTPEINTNKAEQLLKNT